jgi:hypothetical protein
MSQDRNPRTITLILTVTNKSALNVAMALKKMVLARISNMPALGPL